MREKRATQSTAEILRRSRPQNLEWIACREVKGERLERSLFSPCPSEMQPFLTQISRSKKIKCLWRVIVVIVLNFSGDQEHRISNCCSCPSN